MTTGAWRSAVVRPILSVMTKHSPRPAESARVASPRRHQPLNLKGPTPRDEGCLCAIQGKVITDATVSTRSGGIEYPMEYMYGSRRPYW